MPAISQKRPDAELHGSLFRKKASLKGRAPVMKVIRLDRAELKKLEHAARSSTPPLSTSYFIVKAALKEAELMLGG